MRAHGRRGGTSIPHPATVSWGKAQQYLDKLWESLEGLEEAGGILAAFTIRNPSRAAADGDPNLLIDGSDSGTELSPAAS